MKHDSKYVCIAMPAHECLCVHVPVGIYKKNEMTEMIFELTIPKRINNKQDDNRNLLAPNLLNKMTTEIS